MTAEVGHFEIPTDNTERARKFYAVAFGWKMTDVPGFAEYTMVTTGPSDDKGNPKTPGYIGGALAKRSEILKHPVITVVVPEILDAEKAVEKNGGKIVQRKTAIADGTMGFMGYFKDTEGNLVGLYQWPKK